VGDQLTCLFVDNGLLRKVFAEQFHSEVAHTPQGKTGGRLRGADAIE